ncbi:tropomyosin [Boletus reticuloceps]|uniref:Tropomyosin n=1 Tax=Boletus reticuloceps TaxID=495285 RepID=A0A8I3AGG8_9AGAM|nr:tropomyosin [Boletus reticuloceps]
MEKIKEKMNLIRAEADNAIARAEAAETKNKAYEQQLLEKEQAITSLNVQLARLDGDLEAAEAKLAVAKTAQADGEQSKSTNDALARKVVLLEEELDAAEKNCQGDDRKVRRVRRRSSRDLADRLSRLRQVDVKAEHFERQVQRAEQERDQWEQKYEDMHAKYKNSQAELDNLTKEMEGI